MSNSFIQTINYVKNIFLKILFNKHVHKGFHEVIENS